jgi:hypothetical protein
MRVSRIIAPAIQALAGRFWQFFWGWCPTLDAEFDNLAFGSYAQCSSSAASKSSSKIRSQGSTSGVLSSGAGGEAFHSATNAAPTAYLAPAAALLQAILVELRFCRLTACSSHTMPVPTRRLVMAISNIHRLDVSATSGHPQEQPALATTPERLDLPEHLKCRVATDQFRGGVSEIDGDVGYPLITILQPTSRVANERYSGHIVGARPGDFFLRVPLPNPIRNGEKGIDVIVAYRDEVFKEWTLDRGQVLVVHLELPAGCHTDQAGLSWRRGNALIKTQRLFLLCENQPFEMPLTRGEMKFFRDLIRHFRSYTDEHGRRLPSYKFSTVLEKNHPKGPWFYFTFTDLGWVTGAEYDQARQLSEELDATLKQRRMAHLSPSPQEGAK